MIIAGHKSGIVNVHRNRAPAIFLGVAVLLLIPDMAAAQAVRAARGSSGTLTRLGRETALYTSIGQSDSVLSAVTRYQQQSAQYGTSAARTSPGNLFAPRHRSGGGGLPSTSSSAATPLILPIARTNSQAFVPLRFIPRTTGYAVQSVVNRVASNVGRGYGETFHARHEILSKSGIGRLNALVYSPEVLIRDRANPLPYDALNVGAKAVGATLQYEGLHWDGETPFTMPEVEKVSAHSVWEENLSGLAKASLVRGREAMQAGQFQDASVAYRNAQIADPDSAEARAGQLCSELAAQQYESASITFDRILNRDGAAGFDPRLKLAELWPNGDQLRGSITAAQNLVLLFPERATAKALVIYLRWLSGDRTDAFRLAREIKTMPTAGDLVRLEDFLKQGAELEAVK